MYSTTAGLLATAGFRDVLEIRILDIRLRQDWLRSQAARVTWQASDKNKINGFVDPLLIAASLGPRIPRFIAKATLTSVPLAGWALSSVEDEPLRFFHWFDLPRIVVAGEETLEEVHEVLFNVLVALALLHVIGAVKHWIAGRVRRRNSVMA